MFSNCNYTLDLIVNIEISKFTVAFRSVLLLEILRRESDMVFSERVRQVAIQDFFFVIETKHRFNF